MKEKEWKTFNSLKITRAHGLTDATSLLYYKFHALLCFAFLHVVISQRTSTLGFGHLQKLVIGAEQEKPYVAIFLPFSKENTNGFTPASF